jgi:hypothetical protein
MNARQFNSRWFRVYDEALADPKIQMLNDKQHRFWFNCMCLASRNGGNLPSVEHIAWSLRLRDSVVVLLLDELRDLGLLDYKNDIFTPHNWDGRQFRSDVSTARVHAFRERLRNVRVTRGKRDETVSETVPEQNRTEQSRTEQTGNGSTIPGWDEFRTKYPAHRFDEEPTLRAYLSREDEHGAILAGVRVAVESQEWTKEGGKFVPKSSRFISDGIYKDLGRFTRKVNPGPRVLTDAEIFRKVR